MKVGTKTKKIMGVLVCLTGLLYISIFFIPVSPDGCFYNGHIGSDELAYYEFKEGHVTMRFLGESSPTFDEGSYLRMNDEWIWSPSKGDVKNAVLHTTLWKIRMYESDGTFLEEYPRLWRYPFVCFIEGSILFVKESPQRMIDWLVGLYEDESLTKIQEHNSETLMLRHRKTKDDSHF